MRQTIQVLSKANRKTLCKTFSGSDLAEQPFAVGKDFKVIEEPVSDLQSLSKILQSFENNPTQTISEGHCPKVKPTPSPATKKPSLLHLANGV